MKQAPLFVGLAVAFALAHTCYGQAGGTFPYYSVSGCGARAVTVTWTNHIIVGGGIPDGSYQIQSTHSDGQPATNYSITIVGGVCTGGQDQTGGWSSDLASDTITYQWRSNSNPQPYASTGGSAALVQQILPTGCAGGYSASAGTAMLTLGTPPVAHCSSIAVGVQVPAHSGAHTLAYKINGVQVGATQTSLVDSGSPQTMSTADNNAKTEGDTWEVIVDGVSQGVNRVGPTQHAGDGSIICDNVTFTRTVTATPVPTPTPAATVAPTATPSATPLTTATPWGGGATPTPVAGSSPPISVIRSTTGGTSYNSSAVTVVNPQDIYKPITDAIGKLPLARDIYDNVLKAVNDSGSSAGTAPAVTQNTQGAGDYDARGHLDDLQGQADDAVAKAGAITSGFSGKVTSIAGQLAAMPSSFGSATSIPVPFDTVGAIAGISLPAAIDLSPFMGWINMLRALLLWLLRIYMVVRTFRLFNFDTAS